MSQKKKPKDDKKKLSSQTNTTVLHFICVKRERRQVNTATNFVSFLILKIIEYRKTNTVKLQQNAFPSASKEQEQRKNQREKNDDYNLIKFVEKMKEK